MSRSTSSARYNQENIRVCTSFLFGEIIKYSYGLKRKRVGNEGDWIYIAGATSVVLNVTVL